MKKKIVFAGGDKRQLYAARKLSAQGLNVFLSGFDKLSDCGLPKTDDIYFADVIVLPVTGVKGDTVPVYYSDNELKLNTGKLRGKLVIMGKSSTLNAEGCEVYDLLKRGDFLYANALPSAEGALTVAMENYEGTISGAKTLVIGYGRIGESLSKILKALNAEVTAATRSDKKAQKIKADGNTPLYTPNLKSFSGYDIVFNTADALVVDRAVLKNSESSALIIDLASGSGGVDFKAAKELGFKAIHALGLPGRYSPKAAGGIISDAILAILKEE